MFQERLPSGHKRATVHELTEIVTACTEHVQIQARPNPSMERRVEYTFPPKAVKLLQNYSLLSRGRPFSVSVDPDKSVLLHHKTRYPRIFRQLN